MLLMMALILAIGSAVVEIQLVGKVAWLERWYTNGVAGIPGTWINNGVSFALSALLGLMFGADGLVVFMAGILSSAISMIYYSGKKTANKAGWDMPRVRSDASGIMVRTNELREPAKDLFTLIKTILKIVTMPVRFFMAAVRGVNTTTEFCVDRYQSVHDETLAIAARMKRRK